MAQSPDTPDWYGTGQTQPAQSFAEGPVTVGVASQTIAAVTGQLGVALLADAANTGTIYVAATGPAAATNWPLAAGAFLFLETNADVAVIASAAGQTLHVVQLASS